MEKLRSYSEFILGSPLSVVMGTEKGLLIKDDKQNYYIVTGNFSIIKSNEDNAFEDYSNWC